MQVFPVRFQAIRNLVVSRVAILLLVVSASLVSVASGNDSEPLYYIYHGNPRSLTLDSGHVAVHFRTATSATGTLPTGLSNRGFTAGDIEERPLGEWLLLRTQNVLSRPRTNAQTNSANEAQAQAASVHSLIRSIGISNDAGIDFISPVFRDNRGEPVLLTHRILIGFEPGVSAADRAKLRTSVTEGAVTELREFPQPNDERWQIQSSDGFEVLNRANALAGTPGVRYAEPDMIASGHQHLVPTDPGFSQSWGLHNTGQLGGAFNFDLQAVQAWDITLGSPSVIVVILDIGVQQDHPDINQIAGRDFTSDAFSNPGGGPVTNNDNHGTLVAGCVSERINNGLGTTGLAPGAKVASARVATDGKANGSFTFEFSWVIDALNWAQSIGARVTNNSNGYDTPSGAIESAYASTRAAGLVHFASTGNDSSASIGYPASIPGVNAVGSVNRFGQESQFSNYGPGLKFLAPGEQILTTDRTGKKGEVNGDYVTVSGTSFSSPYAAAEAALIISQNPTWTADQVETQMAASSGDMGPPGYDTTYGYGLLNAYQALTTPLPTPTPTATPTPSITPTPTATPTPTPTGTPSPTPTPTPTVSPTPSASPTPTPTPPVPNYVANVTTGALIVPGLTDIGNHCDDCSSAITLPFDVTFYDRTFPAGSSVNVSSDGYVQFSGNVEVNQGCIPVSSVSNMIAPALADFWTIVAINPSAGIFTSISGTAPNRILNIEWRASFYPTFDFMNFELRLYEGRHHIDFIYGTAPLDGLSSIGVQRDTGSEYLVLSCFTPTVDLPAGTQYTLTEITITPAEVELMPGDNFNGTLANFTTTRSGAVASDFIATVQWGDGVVNQGAISSGPSGNYIVTGNHPIGDGPSSATRIRVTDTIDQHSDLGIIPAPPPPTPTPSPVPVPTIMIFGSGSVVEGGTTQFVISASNTDPFQARTIHYSMSGKASQGLDYTLDGTPGTAIIPAGASSTAVVLHALTDGAKEKSEKVTMTLSQGIGYNLSKSKKTRKATITIINLGP